MTSIFFVVDTGDSLELAEVPVLKATEATLEVRPCRATGYLQRIPRREAHEFPEDALKAAREENRRLKERWQEQEKRINALCEKSLGVKAKNHEPPKNSHI